MDSLFQTLEGNVMAAREFTLQSTVLSLLLAFVLGQALAWVYYATHSGLSYSRSFVQSLVLITVVVSMVMSAIANSFITAVGLMGALAIIRFRNMVKDTRDIAFIFCALVAGMTTGAQRYVTAIVGTVFLCVLAAYLRWSNFGSREPQNGFLQFTLADSSALEAHVGPVLRRYCRSFTLISIQDGGGSDPSVCAYQLMIRDVGRNGRMIAELEAVEGLSHLAMTVQEQLLEV